jgi:hypothetical protein
LIKDNDDLLSTSAFLFLSKLSSAFVDLRLESVTSYALIIFFGGEPKDFSLIFFYLFFY